MDDSFLAKAVINNEYDYSNVLPTIEAILCLVQYCDEMNKQLTKLVEQDEEKNKQFKSEYKEFMYKRSYGQIFEVSIREKSFQYIICKDYDSFKSAALGGSLNGISSMNVKLCMNFHRGKGNTFEEHENLFLITFKPYEIKFTRKSNYNDSSMNQVEQQIKAILKQFPVANCIFCNKQDN